MLILTRKPGESLFIGDDIKITIVEMKGHQIRVGIEAPKGLRIYREEIYYQILEENKQAAESAAASTDDLESLSGIWARRNQSKEPTPGGSSNPSRSSAKDDALVVYKKKKRKDSDE